MDRSKVSRWNGDSWYESGNGFRRRITLAISRIKDSAGRDSEPAHFDPACDDWEKCELIPSRSWQQLEGTGRC